MWECVLFTLRYLKKTTKDDHLKMHLITTKQLKQSDDVERNELNKLLNKQTKINV